jgi:hypothetical protein
VGGHKLIPEMLEQFPYDQWEYAYNQTNIPDTDKGNKTPADSLIEPPDITVSIGDVKLDYKVNKIKWNNETNESTDFTELTKDEKKIPIFDCPDNLIEFKDKIVLDFGEVSPDSIMVKDYLISAVVIAMSNRLAMDRDVKIEGNGKFTFGLYQHMALLISSNSATYTNPSCRRFRVTCSFGENKTCEYLFVLMLGPEWD